MVDSPSQPGPSVQPMGRDRASLKSDPAADNEMNRPPSRASNATSNGTDVSRHPSTHDEKSAPPPGLKTKGDLYEEGDDDDAEEEIDEHAFDHPSTYKPAPLIWVPKDKLGLSDVILEELKAAGVQASDLGAYMNEKSQVKVTCVEPVYRL